MSQPQWINTGTDVSIGTASIESDDDLFTIVDHGLENGDRIVVSGLSGGAVGVLAENGVYWVRDALDDTFAVTTTQAGLPLDFASDGSADVHRFEPALDATELRRGDSGLLTKEGDRFGARPGVHPANDPPVTVVGTTWTVENITGVLYPGLSDDDGPYRFAHPEESGGLDPAHGSLDRIDALDLEVQDHDEDASGQRRVHVVYEVGTPAADPEPPAEVAERLRLATILVPAGGSPNPSVSNDSLVPFTVASGGVLPVRDSTEGPSNPYSGQIRYRRDLHVIEAWDGITWVPIAESRIPVSHSQATNSNITSTSFVTEADPAELTFVAPASGVVRIDQTDAIEINGGGSAHQNVVCWASYQVREGAVVGSGTIIQDADNNRAVKIGNRSMEQIQTVTGSFVTLVSGLTPGATYNIRTMHRRDDASLPTNGTTRSQLRQLMVTPQG